MTLKEEGAFPGNAKKTISLGLRNIKVSMWNIEYLGEVTSTNDTARGAGFGHGDVIVAESQTAGRGQRGNSWSSEEGRNLTFSVVLHPVFLPAASQFLLSEAVSLAVADMLAGYGVAAQVKWPNDIYIGGRKTAGILIENDIKGGTLGRSIVGIGLNVNQTEFDPSLPNPTSMKLAAGADFDRSEVLGRLLDALAVRYDALSDGEIGNLERDYHRRLYRAGEPARYSLPDGTEFTGTILGVGSGGELTVGHPDGSTHQYLFKEIEYKLI